MSGESDVKPMDIEPFTADTEARNALPYPGLRPFKKREHRFFFGRSEQVAEIIEILAQEGHFVTAIGPSGCGKSSLIRAGVQSDLELGLIPRAGQRWVNAKMRPGGAPLSHLRDALIEASYGEGAKELTDLDQARLKAMLGRGRDGLARFFEIHPLPAGRRLLLLIDQFEELFRYDIRRSEAEAFVAMLVEMFREPLDQVFVILTMRTDYIGDCTRFPGLAEVINKTFYLIPPLNREQLTEAFARPAAEVDGLVRSELVDRLLTDMHSSEDSLPLAQHALMWMWIRARQQRENSDSSAETRIELTLAHYLDEQVGGLNNALSKHADFVIDSAELGSNAWRDAELFFRQLVQRDGSRYIRRPARVEEIIQSTRSEDESDPLLDIETLRTLVGKLAGDESGFIYVQTESDSGDEDKIPELTEASTIDIGHEALIRQWSSLRTWARAEADAGDQIRTFAKEALDWKQAKRDLLDRLSLETYARTWRGLWTLFTRNGKREGGRFPPNRWARRYLDAETPIPHQGRTSNSVNELYSLGNHFWEASKRRRKRIELTKLLSIVAVAGIPLLGFFLTSLSEQKSVFERLEGDIAATFDRSLDIGKYGDAPAYRALAGMAGKSAEDIALSAPLPLRMWLGDERISESHQLAVDLSELYLDLADLYGIASEHWPTRSTDKPGPRAPERLDPVIKRDPSRLHVPIADATHFKGPGSSDCIALLDAVGELSAACDGAGSGSAPMTPDPALLSSSMGPISGADQITSDCFLRGKGCVDTGEWLKLTRIAPRESEGQLVAVAPDRSVHLCAMRDGSAEIACEEMGGVTRNLRSLGTRLRGLAIDGNGHYLATVNWVKRKDERANFENSGSHSSEWLEHREHHELFTLSLFDLNNPEREPTTFHLRSAEASFRFPSDISRSAELARAAVWLQQTDGERGELVLSAAFDAESSILLQWRLRAQDTQAESRVIEPLHWAMVQLDPSRPVFGAMSSDGTRTLLTGEARLLTFFDLGSLVKAGSNNQGPSNEPEDIIAWPTDEWALLKTQPADLKFVDNDLIAIADTQANAFLIRFGPEDILRLDPPPLFGIPASRFVVDNEESVVYGIAPDQKKGAYILRWNLKGKYDRAMRIRVPAAAPRKPDTLVTRLQSDWRRVIDNLDANVPAGIIPVPGTGAKQDDSAPDGRCGGVSPEPIGLFSIPGTRLWIAACANGTVNILARKPKRSITAEEPYRIVARLKDSLSRPTGEAAKLFCRSDSTPGNGDRLLPSGCWLVITAADPRAMPVTDESRAQHLDIVYHFPHLRSKG